MRGSRAVALVAVALVVACFSERGEPIAAGSLDCALPLDSTTVGTVSVIAIRDLSFQPAEVRIPAGTRVVWLNCERASDAVAHTAMPLTSEETAALREKVARMTGRTVHLTVELDESLIGGLTVRVGDTLYDASVRGRLERLRERLVAGAR